MVRANLRGRVCFPHWSDEPMWVFVVDDVRTQPVGNDKFGQLESGRLTLRGKVKFARRKYNGPPYNQSLIIKGLSALWSCDVPSLQLDQDSVALLYMMRLPQI